MDGLNSSYQSKSQHKWIVFITILFKNRTALEINLFNLSPVSTLYHQWFIFTRHSFQYWIDFKIDCLRRHNSRNHITNGFPIRKIHSKVEWILKCVFLVQHKILDYIRNELFLAEIRPKIESILKWVSKFVVTVKIISQMN